MTLQKMLPPSGRNNKGMYVGYYMWASLELHIVVKVFKSKQNQLDCILVENKIRKLSSCIPCLHILKEHPEVEKPNLVYEYIDGVTVFDSISSKHAKPLSAIQLKKLYNFLLDMANLGVRHEDLCGENVFAVGEDNVHVIDFEDSSVIDLELWSEREREAYVNEFIQRVTKK